MQRKTKCLIQNIFPTKESSDDKIYIETSSNAEEEYLYKELLEEFKNIQKNISASWKKKFWIIF